jgi:hypothetical protein
VTGIPLGLEVTPSAPVDVSGTQTWGSTPSAYTGVIKNDSNTFIYKISATNRPAIVVPESANFTFTLTSTGPLQQGNPPMAVTVQLYPPPSASSPVYPAFSYPIFGLAEESPGTPIAAFNFQDCVTNLLYPYVTNYYSAGGGPMASFDTAIEVANTTSDPFTAPMHATPQNGSCTFYFYNAGTAAAVGTAKEATPITYTTPVVLSGGIYGFMMSWVAPGFTGGYAIGICNFLDGYGYAQIVDNANGLGNWQVMSSYLANVYN